MLRCDPNGSLEWVTLRASRSVLCPDVTPMAFIFLANDGTVVVCRHRDGSDTWLPVDMWLPGGFTF